MNNLFPILIVTMFVALVGPMATGYVGGLTVDLADRTAAQIAGQ